MEHSPQLRIRKQLAYFLNARSLTQFLRMNNISSLHAWDKLTGDFFMFFLETKSPTVVFIKEKLCAALSRSHSNCIC